MNKKIKFLLTGFLILSAVGFMAIKLKSKTDSGQLFKEINPVVGSIESVISTTGTVLPKNRLEIKPPVNGRIESILVKEGQEVKAGQTLAWMSSTERAALLDAARSGPSEKLEYWQEVYKPIALIAPIDAEVIVATTQPGQTVTTADAVLVLSDHLIARAQVDETDIGKIRLAQNAVIGLDAYPDVKIKASVEHIYYESKTVNNVTIYEVDLMPQEDSSLLRSGMNTSIDFIVDSRKETLALPLEAVLKENGNSFVLIRQNNAPEPIRRQVKLGISNDKMVEVISGIGVDDKVLIKSVKYALPKSKMGSNPFMPSPKKPKPAN